MGKFLFISAVSFFLLLSNIFNIKYREPYLEPLQISDVRIAHLRKVLSSFLFFKLFCWDIYLYFSFFL